MMWARNFSSLSRTISVLNVVSNVSEVVRLRARNNDDNGSHAPLGIPDPCFVLLLERAEDSMFMKCCIIPNQQLSREKSTCFAASIWHGARRMVG